MTVYKEFILGGPQGGGKSPFGGLVGLVFLALFIVLGYFLIKGLFTILSFIAPVLLIITAIIDFTVITDFGKFLLKLLKDNPLFGVLAIVLTVVAFPFAAGFLFFRAMMRRAIKRATGGGPTEQSKEKYSDYLEIVEDEDLSDYEEIESLELPQVEKPKDNDYDNLFK